MIFGSAITNPDRMGAAQPAPPRGSSMEPSWRDRCATLQWSIVEDALEHDAKPDESGRADTLIVGVEIFHSRTVIRADVPRV